MANEGRGIYDTPNNLFLNRPGYARPDRADDLLPTPVTAPARQFQGTVFEQALAAIMHAQNEYQRHIDKTSKDQHRYSQTNYKRQIIGFADTDAADGLNTAVASIRARRDQAKARITDIRSSLIKSGDAAQESRNTRYWNRTKPKLDKAGVATLPVALKLIDSATPEELGVLLEELPAYFELWRPDPKSQQRAIAALELRTQQHVPEYDAAVKQLRKAENAVLVVESAAIRLAKSITQGGPASVPVAVPKPGDYDPDK